MSQSYNPYAPPQSADEVQYQQSPEAQAGQYYTASPLKVVLLSLASFGIYDMYWLYKQWKAVREQTRADLSPFWRAMFDIFFVGRLFEHIRHDTTGAGVPAGMTTGALAGLYILASIIGRIAGRVDIGPIWLLGFAVAIPLALLQKEINQYVERTSPGADRNTRFNAGNIVVLIVGGLMWLLVLAGTFLPEQK
ncbi:MAG: hypothetical protein QM820_55515 [Minicystis sp.]